MAQRDWRIYYELAQRLIVRARKLYAQERLKVTLDDTVYALDASTIDLCLSVFNWAPFRKTKAAIKLHTLLDMRGSTPSFIHITSGKVHDVNVLGLLMIEPGAFYVMDRGYLDFTRLYRVHTTGAFFVTRAKRGMDARRVYSAPVDRTTGLICDQTIVLNGFYAAQRYPEYLRRIRFKDPDTGTTLVFLTNNTQLPPETICALYKSRWQSLPQTRSRVEFFFKWTKQHLRITQFYGTMGKAVKAQVRSAVSTYVIVAIVKKELQLGVSLQFITEFIGQRFREYIIIFIITNLSNIFSIDHNSKTVNFAYY